MEFRKLSLIRKAIQKSRSTVFVRMFVFVAGISIVSLSIMGVLSLRISSRQITTQVEEAAQLTLETVVATIDDRRTSFARGQHRAPHCIQ